MPFMQPGAPRLGRARGGYVSSTISVTSGTLDLTALSYAEQAAILPRVVISGSGVVKRSALYADIAALAQWIDGRDPLGSGVAPADGAALPQWTDKSGAGNHYTQANAASQPVYSSAAKAVAGASTQGMISPLAWGASWAAFFAAGYNGPKQERILDGASGNRLAGFHARSAGGIFWDSNPNAYQRGIAGDTNSHLWSARRLSSGAMIQDWDGIARQSWAGSDGTSRAMAINAGAYMMERSDWRIHELAVYAVDLSDAKYEQARGVLAWRNGLVANLPANHTYKSAPPVATVTASGVTVA